MMTRWLTMAVLGLLLQGGVARADGDVDLLQVSYDSEAVGKLDDAISALEKTQGMKDSYVVQLRLGWLLYRKGSFGPAIDAYNKAVSASPKAVEARAGMLLPQMALKRWADAETTAKDLLQIDPANYLGNLRLAFTYYSLHRYADAARYYRKLRDLYPSDVEVCSGLAWSLLKMGKRGEAEKEFNAGLAMAPRHGMLKAGLQTLAAR